MSIEISNYTGVTYSAIVQNGKNSVKQDVPGELENKMASGQDMLSISSTAQESYRNLLSVSYQNYTDQFEREVSDVFEKDAADDSTKSDTFEHHVNRMAAAYDKMKNALDEKYAAKDRKPEYYVSEFGKVEELTKEKEMDMLNKAYESHSMFMASSTQIWAELEDFTQSVVYQKGGSDVKSDNQQSDTDSHKKTASYEKGSIKETAYQAFMSAIKSDNNNLINASDNWKNVRLNLNVSDSNRKMLNNIWDYYAHLSYTGNIC